MIEQDISMTDLLLCPFCGSDNVGLDIDKDHSDVIYSVLCMGCHLSTIGFYKEDDAIRYWNNRHSPWIPVKERNPGKDGRYMVYEKNYNWVGVSSLREGKWDNMCITHWQPLIDPPKETE